MADEENRESKIISDENWKQQARKEKEKLTEKKQPPPQSTSPPENTTVPPANFLTLLNSIVLQIMYSLGRLGDPDTGKNAKVNLDLAKHHIDTLAVLEEKTKGNLTEDEQKVLKMSLHEMRMQYVRAMQG